MNERNVIAIARRLCEHRLTAMDGESYKAGFCPECYTDAELLASHGVLATEALTPENLDDLASCCGCYEGDVLGGAPGRVLETLQRITRGEATHG